MLPPLKLHDPVTRIGSWLLDHTSRITINITAALPRKSKVFNQWAKAWLHDCHNATIDKTAIGSDGSYKIKGQGVSAFVVQQNNSTVFSQSLLVIAHSSYDVEMQASHMAIAYTKEHILGKVIVFIDNQSTLKSLLNVKAHSLLKLSHLNSLEPNSWLLQSPDNEIEFRWIPSHLGLSINELADQMADVTPIGPFLYPRLSIVSRLHYN